MKLDRNLNGDGRGKYGLVKNRLLTEIQQRYDRGDGDGHDLRVIQAALLLESAGVLDWGTTPATEFFVVKLKDQHASAALYGYAGAAQMDGDRELAADVSALAVRAGRNHPNCKRPD